jgi:hypothetical protein
VQDENSTQAEMRDTHLTRKHGGYWIEPFTCILMQFCIERRNEEDFVQGTLFCNSGDLCQPFSTVPTSTMTENEYKKFLTILTREIFAVTAY